MIVAVDIRFIKTRPEFYEIFKRIAVLHPQHSFIFISDMSYDPSLHSENITGVIFKPGISLLSQFKMSSLLIKHKADVFVTGQLLSTNISQCFIAADKITAGSLKKAKVIVADSVFSKKQIAEKYNIPGNIVDVAYYGVDDFQSIAFEEKEQIKEQHAGGNEYFLSTITTKTDLLNLLKAFSVFKKMQKSGMQFLISSPAEMNAEFSEALRLYKFKSEVKLLENDKKELAGITGAAYAFVYPGEAYVHVLPALRSGVPVITHNSGVMQEVCSDAALYFNSNDHKDIADKMMLVYKDENLRQQLIEKAKEKVKKYSWDTSAEMLWNSIQKAAN